jgi:hypothetical protein
MLGVKPKLVWGVKDQDMISFRHMVSKAGSSSKHVRIEIRLGLGCLRIVLGPSLAQHGFKQIQGIKGQFGFRFRVPCVESKLGP